jgi:hypothetical protein
VTHKVKQTAKMMVVAEFSSREAIEDVFNSTAYTAIIPLRDKAYHRIDSFNNKEKNLQNVVVGRLKVIFYKKGVTCYYRCFMLRSDYKKITVILQILKRFY